MQHENHPCLFSSEQIAQRIRELAEAINEDFKSCPSLKVVGVLKGSFIFLADLVRQLNLPIEIDFIGLRSYVGTESSGEVKITSDLTSSIKAQQVLIVEDIIDTGITIEYLRELFKLREAKSIHVCSFLSKPSAHQMKQKIDYVGFEIENQFVVGYGLDLDGRYRELPYVAQLNA